MRPDHESLIQLRILATESLNILFDFFQVEILQSKVVLSISILIFLSMTSSDLEDLLLFTFSCILSVLRVCRYEKLELPKFFVDLIDELISDCRLRNTFINHACLRFLIKDNIFSRVTKLKVFSQVMTHNDAVINFLDILEWLIGSFSFSLDCDGRNLLQNNLFTKTFVINFGILVLDVFNTFFLLIKFVRLTPIDVMIFELSQLHEGLFKPGKIK